MAASAGADGCASHDSAEQCMLEGQTWMVLEYCDRGCLQVRLCCEGLGYRFQLLFSFGDA